MSSNVLYQGDSLSISLTDANNTPLSNQKIDITIKDAKGEKQETVTTNEKGEGFLGMDELGYGKYNIIAHYSGNASYEESTNSQNIEFKETTVESLSSNTLQTQSSKRTVTLEPKDNVRVSKTVGEYKVEAMTWKGATVGGLGVWVYKNGQLVDKSSYSSRGHFYMDGQWKWSEWDDGEDSSTYHEYPVSNDVNIDKVEVRF